MKKSDTYAKVIAYAKANGMTYTEIKNAEICPEVDYGYPFLDLDILEIPCAFHAEKAVVLQISTPSDMTPEDTGKSYNKYWDTITDLNHIEKPQYVALDGAYIKLMCWCDWD